jgi:hypothetical protein
MKKTITQEVDCCDICERPHAHYGCDNCGKVYCYDHSESHLKKYAHGVHFGGSDDGCYCLECDAALLKSGDKLHAAYLRVASLRDENAGWYERLKARADIAEGAVSRLVAERKKR